VYSGVFESKQLEPNRAVYYAWQDPMKDRTFHWTTAEHSQHSNLLREVHLIHQLYQTESLWKMFFFSNFERL